jgi:hypothetical protein
MEQNHAKEQAKAQLESILEMARKLAEAQEKNNDDEIAKAIETIQEDALGVEIREGWHVPNNDGEPAEYNILLCTGGPAVRIIGDLDQYKMPISAELQYQDWGTPWIEYTDIDTEERGALILYAEQFYFGE